MTDTRPQEVLERFEFFLRFIEAAREVSGDTPLKSTDVITSYHGPGGFDQLTVQHFLDAREALALPQAGEAGSVPDGWQLVPKELLQDILDRDAKWSLSGSTKDCNCISLSSDAEREYETGTCPHQRLRAMLSASPP